jgi:glycosyltransferase involved in cell wall biosynthesis
LQDKKVSIILPTRNGSKYLSQSIKSCLEQTHENIELIIIDDFSTGDQTLKTVKSFNDKRVRYYRNKKAMGISCCLNEGLKKSEGDYITWTADDNFFDRSAIKNMLSYLLETNEKCVYTSFYCFKNDDLANKSLVRLYDTSLMARHCFACFLFDREVTEQTGLFDTGIYFTQYYDYWLRVSEKFKIVFLDRPMYYSRLHADSLMPTDIKNFKYSIELIIVQYKNNILDKNKAAESLMEAGIKYVAESVKESFLLDFSLKNPLLYKPYIKQKIDELVFKKRTANKSFGRLKKEIEEMFAGLDRKIQESDYEDLKKTSLQDISAAKDILLRRKKIKELMKFLLEMDMYGIFTELKCLLKGYIEEDYILLCNISGLEFNYKFKKSEIMQDEILKESGLPHGNFIDQDIQMEFFINLAQFKKDRTKDYYFYKLKEEFCSKTLYRDPEDILGLLDFFDAFETRKYIYEKALLQAADNTTISGIQKKLQELYSASLQK